MFIEILTTQAPPQQSCLNQQQHCQQLKCPFGVERRVDDSGCEECLCHDPCSEVRCPPGRKCIVDLKYEVSGSGNESRNNYVPVAQCRLENKPGQCPILSGRGDDCRQECYSDADCRDDDKCCANECGSECVSPTAPEYAISTEQIMTQGPDLIDSRCKWFHHLIELHPI